MSDLTWTVKCRSNDCPDDGIVLERGLSISEANELYHHHPCPDGLKQMVRSDRGGN